MPRLLELHQSSDMPLGRCFTSDNAGMHITNELGEIIFSWEYHDGTITAGNMNFTSVVCQCYSCSEFVRVAPEGCWAYESFLNNEWDPDHGYCVDQGRFIKIDVNCFKWRPRISDDEEDYLDILGGESFIERSRNAAQEN